MNQQMRPLAFQGSWYPAGTNEVLNLLENSPNYYERLSVKERVFIDPLLEKYGVEGGRRKPSETISKINAAIVPHAGLYYSAFGIRSVFRHFNWQEIDQVIILAPSHYYAFSESLIYSDFSSYASPFGEISVWEEGLAYLRPQKAERNNLAILKEHALEIPMIASKAFAPKDVEYLLLLVPKYELKKVDNFVDILVGLANVGNDRKLFLISSDFMHYGSRFAFTEFGDLDGDETVLEKIAESHSVIIDSVLRLDPELFRKEVIDNQRTICGRYGIYLAMKFFSKYSQLRPFFETYYHSGLMQSQIPSDVVFYSSFGFY
jgi:AmmeMemoRadiSam system protein B